MNPYLYDVAAAMSQMPPSASVQQIGPPPPPEDVPPPNQSSQPMQPWSDIVTRSAPEPPPPVAPAGPAPPSAPVEAAPLQQGQPPSVEQAPALGISIASPGGMSPAHEVSRLGPTQMAALRGANASRERAISDISENSQQQAVGDEAVYFQHAEEARKREDAAAQVAAQRESEMKAAAGEFSRQAKALTQERLDPGRLWASKSTPQKIASFIAIGLGGFLSGARGGENLALAQVNREIDLDIKAQEANFAIKRGGLEAAHTAYGLAMQRYQNVDAARAFARVSAMDAVAAELARQQAQGRGTESRNRATAALDELNQSRADQVMKAVQFLQPSYSEPKYRVGNRLATYTAKEIDQQQIAKEEERGFELQKIDRTSDGRVREEGVKYQLEVQKKLKEHEVVLPNGETVRAPSEPEAAELRKLVTSTAETHRLVEDARKIRANVAFRATPSARKQLVQIQADLLEAYAVQHNMGALSDQDFKIALDGTADLLAFGNAVEAGLDRLHSEATAKLHARVRTYPGASPKAAGRMPSKFKAD